MNYKIQGFIETTLPTILLYGLVVVFSTTMGLFWGILSVVIFTITHILFIRPEDVGRRYIQNFCVKGETNENKK